MSLILFLVYWIGIPFAIFIAGKWVWRQKEISPIAKGFGLLACVAALTGFLWLAVGETWWVDQQVKELCAKDGGVKVYETVRLSPEKYDELERINFMLPSKYRSKSTDEYYIESDDKFLRESNPKLLRSHAWIVRIRDGKTLGDYVHYARGGGGLPGPWHGSSFHCPEIRKESPSLESLFIKGNE